MAFLSLRDALGLRATSRPRPPQTSDEGEREMSSTMFMDPGNTLENRRQQRIAFARREWSELPAKDLDQVSGYVVDKASGNLYAR